MRVVAVGRRRRRVVGLDLGAQRTVQPGRPLVAATRLLGRQRGGRTQKQVLQTGDVGALVLAERQKAVAGQQVRKVIGDVGARGVDEIANGVFDADGPATRRQHGHQVVAVQDEREHRFGVLNTRGGHRLKMFDTWKLGAS